MKSGTTTWLEAQDSRRGVFGDDRLVAVMVRLSSQHGALAGRWHLEHGFGAWLGWGGGSAGAMATARELNPVRFEADTAQPSGAAYRATVEAARTLGTARVGLTKMARLGPR